MDINGKKLVNIPHAVSNLITNDERQDQAISELEERVRQALVGVFHYKGSVATYADLPVADNQVGDVYNVLDTGANYAWAGTEWDDLSGIVDLSNYVTKDGDEIVEGIKNFTHGFELGHLSINENNNGYFVIDHDGYYETIIGSNFYSTDNSANIGTSTYKWRDLYLSGVVYSGTLKNNGTISLDTVSSGGKVRPSQSNTDLGDSSHQWRDIYSSGVIYTTSIDTSSTTLTFKVGGITKFSVQQYNVNLYQKLLPSSNDSIDIGSSSLGFKDFYLSGKVNLKNSAASIDWQIVESSSDLLEIQRSGVTKLRIGNSYFSPASDGTTSLGLTNQRLKDIYLSGVLSDGTNSVNIADLKALIDYAKAQGWIS